MTTDAQVREFLRRLRAPAPEIMRAVFTRGGCYALVEILQSVFPEAEAWQSCGMDGKINGEHVLAFIPFRGYFDINGKRRAGPTSQPWCVMIGMTLYRRMTPAECRQARRAAPVKWDHVVKR